MAVVGKAKNRLFSEVRMSCVKGAEASRKVWETTKILVFLMDKV